MPERQGSCCRFETAYGRRNDMLMPPNLSVWVWLTNSLLRQVSTRSSLAKSTQNSDAPADTSATRVFLSTLAEVVKVLPSRKMLRATARPCTPAKTYQPNGPSSWLRSNQVVPDSDGRMRAGP